MRDKLVGNSFLVGGGSDAVEEIFSILKKEGIETKANPDVYVQAYKHFGIDEARSLRSRASLRAFGARRAFIITAPDINREAQNALLKTLEEASGGALFFFILPSPETLLPTLRSRMQILELASAPRTGTDATAFLSADPAKRLDMLKPLLEKGEDDKRDLGVIIDFLSSLERMLEKGPEASRAARHEGLESVYRARKYIADKGALVKPLLEHVALLVPRM